MLIMMVLAGHLSCLKALLFPHNHLIPLVLTVEQNIVIWRRSVQRRVGRCKWTTNSFLQTEQRKNWIGFVESRRRRREVVGAVKYRQNWRIVDILLLDRWDGFSQRFFYSSLKMRRRCAQVCDWQVQIKWDREDEMEYLGVMCVHRELCRYKLNA